MLIYQEPRISEIYISFQVLKENAKYLPNIVRTSSISHIL